MPALEPNLARALERCYSLLYLLMRKSRVKSLMTAALANGGSLSPAPSPQTRKAMASLRRVRSTRQR